MVKILSSKDQHLINIATKNAEAKTSAHIVTVIVPASDAYSHYIMMCGFIFASFLDLFLWYKKILILFPSLLCIQLLAAFLFPLIPGMKALTLKLLPKSIYHRRAALAAAEKRLAVSKNVNSSTPVLLIYISCAEHYIHIFPNTVIKEKITDHTWDNLVKELSHSIPKIKIASACVHAIEKSGGILSEHWKASS